MKLYRTMYISKGEGLQIYITLILFRIESERSCLGFRGGQTNMSSLLKSLSSKWVL